ncbi:MAG TPA: hypothetical protein VKM55_02540, partial [Candidatus Lokiarchaeia archaeon]|nr:hypothetical protein [Candidatus Lokiarchaeia archaeon]
LVSYYLQAMDNASNTSNLGNASYPYSYGLNYLQVGENSVEFATPVKLDVTINVAVPGNLTLATFNPLDSVVKSFNFSSVMAKFDLNFTGFFSGTINMTYYYGGSITGNVTVYHWDGTAWRLLLSTINSQQGTVRFSVSSLSPFIIGLTATPTGFDILKFVETNWLLLSIIAIALIVGIVAVVAVSRKKKSAVKTKTTKELIAKRMAAGSPQSINEKMVAAKPQMVGGKLAVIEGKKAGAEKYQKSEDALGPKTAKELEELQRTEQEVTAKMDVKLCIVHKGPIKGANYSCPQCNTFYCLNCAATLASNGEGCWSCGHKIELDATLTAAAAKQLQSEEKMMFYCPSCGQYHEIKNPDFVAWENCPVCSQPMLYSKPCPSCNQPIALSKELYTAYKDKTIPCPNCNRDVVL